MDRCLNRATVVCLAFFLALVFSACETREEGTPPDPSYNTLISSGKAALEEGDSDRAYNFFVEADRLRREDPAANLGIGIADLLQLINLLDQALSFGSQGLQSTEAKAPSGGADTEGAVVLAQGAGDILDTLLSQIFDGRLDELVTAVSMALADPELVFEIGTIPVSFQGEVVLRLSGDWDRADILLLDGVGRLIRSGFDMLLSVDLNLDFSLLLDLLATDMSDMNSTELSDLILKTIHQIATDPRYPSFLLSTPEAEWRMPRAGIDLGYWAEDTLSAFRSAVDPVGPFGYVDSVSNGIHDPGEPFFLGDGEPVGDEFMAILPELLVILDQLNQSLWDGTAMDREPGVDNSFDLAFFNPILEGLGVWGFLRFPAHPVDLARYFTDPEPEKFKESLLAVLSCALDRRGPLLTLLCLLENINPAS